jgi:hypothetical protein
MSSKPKQISSEQIKKQMQIFEEMAKESTGLGDTIAKFTGLIGIKPCNACKRRQKKLNKMFPYENQN